MKVVKGKEKKVISVNLWGLLAFVVVAIMGIAYLLQAIGTSKPKIALNQENRRAMSYEQYQDGDDAVNETEYVKFNAFFLRDLNGDGYAEKIKGTCKEIGKQDALYMEINVLTKGYLKDGKIQINGKNFYFQTAIPKDNQLKENYIGTNIREMELNQINNGTQKMMIGLVTSGNYMLSSEKTATIGNNINNYSRNDNEVVLTGTYVDENENEIEITKVVPLTVDWYGTTKTEILNKTQNKNIETAVNEENGTFNLDFKISAAEVKNQLLLSKGEIEAEIPEISGIAPTKVEAVGTGIEYAYNEGTRKLTITRTATTDEQGNITNNAYSSKSSGYRYNEPTVKITYPIEAYQAIGEDSITVKIPVSAYFEGYNNPNSEFRNPYKSNIAKDIIVLNYSRPAGTVANIDIKVGKYVYNPTSRYMISKEKPLKIYNEISSEEKDDLYSVRWYVTTGTDGEGKSWTVKETKNEEAQVVDKFIKANGTEDSMENVTTNVGIYFSNPESMLGENGFIKVYDDETGELLESFTKENWSKYTEQNSYKYETPVKNIRVETSNAKASTGMTIYNVKKLDDKYITEHYTREEFDDLKYIKSTLTGYFGGEYFATDTHQAIYEAPYSVATIGISKNTISTQVTEKNEIITITAEANQAENKQGWIDGTFLVKLPEEILTVDINSVNINNNQVSITNYELVEKDGTKFIKINTKNKNTNEQSYKITIDADITPDPRSVTVSRSIELYATNENAADYYYKADDIYDLNSNGNITEKINKTSTSISLVSPNSLLTNQTISNFDDNNTVIVSPEVADITPTYTDTLNEATIGVQLKNNYSSTISEVVILGKIPFEGNRYVINQGDMCSTFTTMMKNTGIQVPESLQGQVTVYYSESENPSKELSNETNGWKTKEQVTDWSKIKTYLIDFGDTVINPQDEYVFNYVVQIPAGVEYNKVSYSHHAIYFALDTDEGKYRTKTEPNKIGVRIAEKYMLELTKYQQGKDKKVLGSTYSIAEVINNEIQEGKSATTDNNGTLKIYNLYANRTYEIKEIISNKDYDLNQDTIRFIAHANRENGDLTVEKISGTTREEISVSKGEGKPYKVEVKVEDEAKAKLKITKLEKGTDTKIQGVVYNIQGENLPSSGKRVRTNVNGEITVTGLKVGAEYTIKEVEAEGYYLTNDVKFRINNNNGTYNIEITEGEVKTSSLTEENDLPVGNIEIEDEKIPTYNLEISKIKKLTNVAEGGNTEEIEYLEGAKFKLYKDGEEIGNFISDANGKITINNLYQYVDGKDFNATYVLKETLPPEGYSKIKDTTFKVQEVEGELKFIEDLQDGQTAKTFTQEENTIKLTVEDTPSFKLTKKDGETDTPLADVKFAIYNIDNVETPAKNSKGEIIGTKETIDGKEYYVVTTNNSGELTLDLPEGLYKIVEVEAPEKYNIEGNIYYVGIGASRETKIMGIEKWAQSVGKTGSDRIQSVASTEDGGYIVGGYFNSSSITTETTTLINNGSSDGFIIKYNADGEEEWAKSVGGTNYDYIQSVASTEDGGYIVGGYFSSSSISTETTTLTNTGSYDSFIIKYNKEGEAEWAKSIGGTNNDYINSVASTEDGGYIVGGYFNSSSITTETTTLTSKRYEDGFIIKYNAEGIEEWAKSIGGTNSDYINSVASTEDGGYIVGGYFYSGSITTETTTLTNKGDKDGFIIKYKATGEEEWAKSVGGTGSDRIQSVASTEDGGYIVGGYFYSGSITTETTTLTNKGSTSYSDGFIIKYNIEGEEEWAKSVGGKGEDGIQSVASTEDGGYIVGGYFNGTITTETTTLTDNGNMDGFIIKYNRDGEEEWAKSVGGASSDQINSVASTQDGGYIVGGYFDSRSITTEATTLINKGSRDGFIIKFKEKEAPNFHTNWMKQLGGASSDQINSVASTQDGGYIVGGYFKSSRLITETTTLTSKGNEDSFIIKYNQYGQEEWAKSVGGTNYDYIQSVASTEDGGYIVGGYFYSGSITTETTILTNKGMNEGFIIKYDQDGREEWAKSVGGVLDDYIISVASTEDGGYIVGGYFVSSRIRTETTNLINKGNHNSFIIKYNGDGEEEWAKSIGGTGQIYIRSVASTEDGGYIVGGYFYGNLTTETITSNGNYDGLIIKYNQEGEEEWAKSIGGTGQFYINSVASTEDGGYIVGGYFFSNSITTITTETTLVNKGGYDGFIIKYNIEGNVEWEKSVGGIREDTIYSVAVTQDGGYIVGGKFSLSMTTETTTLIRNGSVGYDGFIIKYNSNGEEEWAKSIGGIGDDIINSTIGTEGSSAIAVGYFSNTIEDEKMSIISNGNSDGIILKVNPIYGAQEQSILKIENNRKEFKITTDVKELDGIKGGSISGEDRKPYEKVKYGDDSTKEIKMIPDENYEIIGITVNGEEYQFERLEDGSYVMPQFTDVIEDKHIVVTYSLKERKITINKVDKLTGEKLEGATFKLDQIEEREEPINVVGNLTNNSNDYIEADETNEITGVLGELTNNGTYYFVEQDGKLYPTNSKTYQTENVEGATAGVQNSTANSYIELDLTEKTGKYLVVINAEVSSQSSYDYGYATITNGTSTTTPTYSTTTGRFMYISGTNNAKDYTSGVLEGGSKYKIHLGYRKNASTDTNQDQVIINSIKVYEANTFQYNFVENNGKYESTNIGKPNTTSNSYIPIDLTAHTGKYNLTVNAQVSSQSYDYGYATVTEDTNAPAYNTSTGRFIYISGTTGQNAEAKDYTTVLEGGRLYYLHFGYYKNADTDTGDDKFTVNSIEVTLNDSELYHTEVTTNSEGQAITQIPFGKYMVTEIVAPEGYQINTSIPDIEFRETEGAVHEFTIEDEKFADIIVHHYLKNKEGEYTTIKVAEDERKEGVIDEEYSTEPKINLKEYELEKDTNGDMVIPENAVGLFRNTTQEIIYYYENAEIPLTVHHYIEGTENKVPLKSGKTAEDVVSHGEKNEDYTTTAISDELLADDYELVEIPENANGTYQYDEVIVIYYYKKVVRPFVLTKYAEDGTTKLGGATFRITNNADNSIVGEYTTDSNGKITLNLGVGTYTVKEIQAPETYEKDDTEKTIEVNKESSTINVEFINSKIKGTVTVHYYVEGTTTKVKLTNGNDAEDVLKTGDVGAIYGTKPAENVAEEYELVNANPENSSGEYINGNIDVIYYYRLSDYGYRVEYYYDEVIDNTKTESKTAKYGSKVENYVDKIINGYVFDKTEGLPLTISANPENNVIKVYYVKRADLSYTVNYLEKGTNTVLKTAKVVGNKQFNDIVRAEDEVVMINKYNYDSWDKETLTIGTNNAENFINLYYVKKDANLVVKYVDEITGQEISTRTTKTGKVDDEYTTTPKEIAHYILTRDSGNIEGTLTEDEITVIYYYKHDSAGVVVNHLDVNTNMSVADQETISGKQGDSYTAQEKEIEGYDLVTERYPENAVGNMAIELTTVNYYYVKKTNVTAKYIDKNTNEEIADREVINGHEKDPYTTETKDIQNYVLVEEPRNKTGLMTAEPIEVIYYYVQISAGVIEKHIDEFTNELLDSRTYEGNEGDSYTTTSKTFTGYDLNENRIPENATGTMTVEPIEVRYYYNYKTNVVVKHIDKATGREIVSREIINGHVGEEYHTEKKEYKEEDETTLPFKDYSLVEEPTNKNGTMTRDEITVTYYYAKNSAGVQVNYIDIKTNEPVATQDRLEGHIGDTYTTHEKDVAGYDLVEERYPVNSTGTMKEQETVVNYYYIKKGKITVKYIDKITGEELTQEIEINGHEGDNYDTEEKTFDGYKLEKIPENAKGQIGTEDITVIYYYLHNVAGVIVNHFDLSTGEKLAEEERIEGHEGDNYETHEKEIEGYNLVRNMYPENATGTMTKEEIKVDYYYIPKAKVIVKHKDKDTKEEIAKEEVKEGSIGDSYETEEKKIENYKLEKELYPANSKGTMDKKETEVIYYYKKVDFNLTIDKIIKEIRVNGETKAVNGDIAKFEVHRKRINDTEIKVVYTIRVTNSSSIDGSATIEENIPEGMKMLAEDNEGWNIEGGKATLTTKTIKSGETEEYTVILTWDNSEENFGLKNNIVKIVGTENEEGVNERDLNDNADDAQFIITISTGVETIVTVVGITAMILLTIGVSIVIIKKRREK